MIEMDCWFTQYRVQMQKLCLTEDCDTRHVGGVGVGAAEPSRFGQTYQPPPINTKLYQMPPHLA
jgi:hypothetical protein